MLYTYYIINTLLPSPSAINLKVDQERGGPQRRRNERQVRRERTFTYRNVTTQVLLNNTNSKLSVL